jgi:hypothetical protein
MLLNPPLSALFARLVNGFGGDSGHHDETSRRGCCTGALSRYRSSPHCIGASLSDTSDRPIPFPQVAHSTPSGARGRQAEATARHGGR